MPTISMDPAVVDVEAQPLWWLTLGVPDGSGWRVWLADRDSRLAELPWTDITAMELTDGRGQVPTCRFIAARHLGLDLIADEIQVAYDGIVQFWGPVLAVDEASDSAGVQVSAVGADWYLSRRLVHAQQPWSRNWVKNPEFDQGLANWSPSGSVTVDPLHESGTQSLRIDDGAIRQNVSIDLQGQVTAVLAVRVRLDDVTVPTDVGASLTMTASPSHVGDTHRVTVLEDPGGDDPVGQWLTLLVSASWTQTRPVPTSVRLDVWSTGGIAYVDSVAVTLSPTEWLRNIVDRNRPARRPRRVDLNTALTEIITASADGLGLAVTGSPTGVMIEDDWSDRPDIRAVEVLRVLSDREDGIEPCVELSPTHRVMTGHHPHRGTELDAGDVTLRTTEGPVPGRLGMCAVMRRSRSADAARTEMNYIDESGVWGSYRDVGGFGGVLLQDIAAAPIGTPVSDLPGKARDALRSSDGSVEALAVTTEAWAILGAPWGTRVRATEPTLAVDAVYRVETRRITPHTGTVDLTLNRWGA